MSDIDIVRYHSLSLPAAKSLVQKTVDELAVEHELRSAWQGNALSFERSGLHGEICVTDSEIHIRVALGLLMKPLRGEIVNRIEEKLDKLLPAEEAEPQAAKPAGKTECGRPGRKQKKGEAGFASPKTLTKRRSNPR